MKTILILTFVFISATSTAVASTTSIFCGDHRSGGKSQSDVAIIIYDLGAYELYINGKNIKDITDNQPVGGTLKGLNNYEWLVYVGDNRTLLFTPDRAYMHDFFRHKYPVDYPFNPPRAYLTDTYYSGDKLISVKKKAM